MVVLKMDLNWERSWSLVFRGDACRRGRGRCRELPIGAAA